MKFRFVFLIAIVVSLNASAERMGNWEAMRSGESCAAYIMIDRPMSGWQGYGIFLAPGSETTRFTQWDHLVTRIAMDPGCVLTMWQNADRTGDTSSWHGGAAGYATDIPGRRISLARCQCGVTGGIPLIGGAS
jgi:hypothetical protein